MRSFLKVLIRNAAVAFLLCAAVPHAVFATGDESATDLQADPAPCLAATAAGDADKIIAICGTLIGNEKTLRADLIKALIARAGAYDRNDQIDRAIGDYDTVLRLDPTLADIFNSQRRTLAPQGRPAPGAGRFCRRDQAESGSSRRKGQSPVAGAGAGAAGRADGGLQQAEF